MANITLERLTDESGASPQPGVRWTSTHRTISGAKRAANRVGRQTYRILDEQGAEVARGDSSGWWDPR